MSNVLKHRFTSAKTDGPDATQVQPSHWNDGHLFTGGNAGDILTRDPTDAIYGAKWAGSILPIYGTWNPQDYSGAGLILTVYSALYAKIDRLVFVSAYVAYPTTASGAAAVIGALPFNSSGHGGAYQTFGGVSADFYLGPGTSTLALYNPTTRAVLPNSSLSGTGVIFSGVYLTP